MKTSTNGERVAHYFESCSLVAYEDPGSTDGLPITIGWGHIGPEVHVGLVWSQQQCDATFLVDLERFERAVTSAVKVALTQGQFDALVLFTYNVGSGALNGSTLLRLLNLGDYAGAAGQFERWNKNAGQPMRGLTRRRAAEAALFNGSNGKEAIAIGVAAA